jgi:hypothetical protein
MAGALSADQAILSPSIKVASVRSAFKWELEDNELYASIAELVDSAKNADGLASSLALQNIIKESTTLLTLLKSDPRGGEHWRDYAFASELVMVSIQFADRLKALRLNAISGISSGGQMEIF